MMSHIDGKTCRHLSQSEMFWRPTLTVRNGRYVCYRTVRSGQEALRVAADRGATNDQESKVYADLDTVYRFTLPLCSRETHVREAALLHIEKLFNQWLNGLCSPEVVTQSHSNDSEQDTIPPPCYSLISLHAPSIASLANLCPFEDVRDKSKHILLMIKVISLFRLHFPNMIISLYTYTRGTRSMTSLS